MKKLLSVILAVAMVGTLAACGSGNGGENKDTNVDTVAGDTAAETGKTDDQNSDKGDLIMVTEAGFAPYEYTEDGQTVVGVDVDIANEIAKALGRKLVIQNTTFDGALLAVQQGKADFAAAGISVNEERQKVMDFSIEYATSKQVVVVKKDAGRVAKVDDLTEDTAIGVQTGTVADMYFKDDMGWQPKEYNKFMEAALDLKNDRIDCIVMDLLPAQQMVEANDDLEVLDGEVFTDKYAIAVQKGNQELLDEINAVLEKLISEGKIEEYTINHTTK